MSKEKKVRLLDEYCHKCNGQMNSWDMRLTKTFKVFNTCETCAGKRAEIQGVF